MLIVAVTTKSKAATFSYLYDSLNRLTNVAYSDGSHESYSYDNAGNRLSRTTGAATTTLDNIPPSVPTNLVQVSFTPSQINIGWNSASDTGGSGLAGYNLSLNGDFIVVSSTTNFTLSGLVPNTEYCLSVAAFDHSGNISAQSSSLCLTTPPFQSPIVSPIGLSNGYFQMNIASGTPGPYNLFVSSNLVDWQLWTNFVLPSSSNIFDSTAFSFPQRFYQLRWSTNTP
jgi:YD repeat-containing protein